MEGMLDFVTCLPLTFSGAFSFFASGETFGASAGVDESEPQPEQKSPIMVATIRDGDFKFFPSHENLNDSVES